MCALLALFCTSAASAFRKETNATTVNWLQLCRMALSRGLNVVQEYGQVRAGQRSIVDPLDALVKAFEHSIRDEERLSTLTKKLVDAAYEACQATAHMKPMVGRASYVDPSLISSPDAGASAISIIISSIYKASLILSNLNENK